MCSNGSDHVPLNSYLPAHAAGTSEFTALSAYWQMTQAPSPSKASKVLCPSKFGSCPQGLNSLSYAGHWSCEIRPVFLPLFPPSHDVNAKSRLWAYLAQQSQPPARWQAHGQMPQGTGPSQSSQRASLLALLQSESMVLGPGGTSGSGGAFRGY